MATRTLHTCLYLLLLALLCGCAAAKNSNRQFHKPKYKVRTHAKPGQPSVAQTWWSSLWFWQRNGQKPAKRKNLHLQ